MNRLILALLALFAGLVAQTAPAMAHDCAVGEAAVGAAEASLAVVGVAAAGQAVAAPMAPGEQSLENLDLPLAECMAVAIPAVRTGIDRARE